MVTRERRSLEERWQAFQKLDKLTEHWYWRPGWRVGRSFYTWHLTFEHADELHELVEHLQADLDTPALDLVPMQGLHLTMQGLGFVDEVSEVDRAAIVAAAEKRLRHIAPFDLNLGPIDPDHEGTGLLVDPWAPVEQVRSTIREAIADVWGPERVPEPAEGFRPHVTIGYSASDTSTAELQRTLEALRTVSPAPASISHVQLIRLNRDERIYQWNVVASVPFGK